MRVIWVPILILGASHINDLISFFNCLLICVDLNISDIIPYYLLSDNQFCVFGVYVGDEFQESMLGLLSTPIFNI